MGLKEELDKGLDAAKKAAANLKDAIGEAGHRGAAEGEATKRDLAGDEMTPGEKLGSALNQAKETTLADVDHLKRDVRGT
jgi:hypothetical protein